MKGLRVTKIVKEMRFERVWGKLEAKKMFVRFGKSSISVFQEFFASINKIFILGGGLGTRLSFYEV